MNITRRDFLKSTGIIAAGIPLAKVVGAAPFQPKGAMLADWRLRQIPTICAACKSRCLMVASITGPKLNKLMGNPLDPFTQGRLCAKGYAAIKTLYDPDRLKFPLKRVGPRGKGQWRRINWGEAIDTIADNLQQSIRKHGPDSVALMANGASSRYIVELFRELKIEQLSNISREFCSQNQESAWQDTFGEVKMGQAFVDFSQADCIVLFGSHFGENMQLPEVRQISAALARGAKLIVIDPRMSVMAAKADYHLMIRPGTDSALLLGWINSLIENKFYNGRFVREYTEGFPALAQKCAEFPLSRVAELTDLALEDLKECLELIANSSPNVLFYSGNFSAWYGNDYERLRALAIIRVLTAQQQNFLDYTTARAGKLGQRADPPPTASEIIRATNKGEVKFLGCWGHNPFKAATNPYKTMAAFEKADFTFCCDIYPTETASYADIILPEATFLERMDGIETWDDTTQQVVALRYPVVEPMFESKGPYWIVKQLSSRLGKGRAFRFDSVKERVNYDLRDMHLSAVRIRQNGGLMVLRKNQPTDTTDTLKLEFSTPSRKIEFATADQRAEKQLLPPDFQFSSLPPKGFSRLLNGRSPVHSGSTLNNPWLVHEVGENELWLNDRVAAKLKIKNGDRLYLENQDGIRSIAAVKIKVTPGIRVDCVFLAHGFGAKSPFMEIAFNRGLDDGALMTRSSPDPTTGVRGIRGNFIRFVSNGSPVDIPQLDTPPAELRQNSRWWLDSFGSFEQGALRGRYV